MNRICVAASLVLLLLVLESSSAAQRVVHRTRFGETYASIARDYYGDAKLAVFIKLTNGRDESRLRAGDRIRVPTAWVYLVPKTTTVSTLAHRLLGDRRRSVALTTFNRVRGRRVRAGTSLIVPFTVTHEAKAGDSFASLSKRYYGNASRAKLIATYNFLRGTQPAVKTQLEIPIGRVRITPSRLTALTNAFVLGISPKRQQEDRAALQEANALLRKGHFWRVPLRLVRLLSREQPSDTYIAEVFKLIAIAYVALDQRELAVLAFEEALLRQPTLSLDPVTVSPKVISAFADAKARKRGGP